MFRREGYTTILQMKWNNLKLKVESVHPFNSHFGIQFNTFSHNTNSDTNNTQFSHETLKKNNIKGGGGVTSHFPFSILWYVTLFVK